MRLLHTSDWHLGRTLHRADLRDAQAGFLDALVDTVRSERVDAVLVAGDVYDRAIPPVDAVELCESALIRLREAGARVVLISGNHDSARRLGFSSALVDASGVHLRTRVAACAEPVVLTDRHGEVAIYGVPYLEPEAVRAELPAAPALGATDGECGGAATQGADGVEGPVGRGAGPRGHAGVLGRALDCVRADLRRRPGVRSVALAHAWVTGAAPSESERDITVGGVASVPASLFDGIDYSALGHLHGPQVLSDGLRYSGSPLAYSFSEATQVKGSWLVELDARGLATVMPVPAPVPRRLHTLRARFDELLSSPAFTPHEHDWLTLVMTDTARPDGAMDRLRSRFPHVLVLRHEPEGVVTDGLDYRARLTGRSDQQVGEAFVEHVRGRAWDDVEAALFAEALEAGRLAAAGA